MIKRNGVAIMNARSNNVTVSKEILDIIQDKKYLTTNNISVDVAQALKECIDGTIFYKENLPEKDYHKVQTTIEITEETTTKAARRLSLYSKDVVVLNFASGKNPGGGFLSGALA